jgi:hypothetical protein
LIRCQRPELADALAAAGIAEAALVFVTDPANIEDWERVRAELMEAFRLTRLTLMGLAPVVYVVDTDDLLGRNGSGKAMVACGLLSAARTAALEQTKTGTPINVLAVGPDTAEATVAEWVVHLSWPGGPQGELVHLGARHLGQALA